MIKAAGNAPNYISRLSFIWKWVASLSLNHKLRINHRALVLLLLIGSESILVNASIENLHKTAGWSKKIDPISSAQNPKRVYVANLYSKESIKSGSNYVLKFTSGDRLLSLATNSFSTVLSYDELSYRWNDHTHTTIPPIDDYREIAVFLNNQSCDHNRSAGRLLSNISYVDL
jgi:hypothetical protein